MRVATTLGLSAILGASGFNIARGSTPAVDVAPGDIACATSSNSGTYGWEFTLDNAVIVTGLGVFSYTFAPLQNSYPVAIWNWFPTGAPLLEAAVKAGSATVVPSNGGGSWLFVSLGSPVTLAPGTYVIGAFIPSQDVDDSGSGPSNGLTSAPIVHYLSERDSHPPAPGDPQLQVPTFNDNGSSGYFGPNFQFVLAPEPSYLGLLFVAGVGLTALAAIQRRRRSARFGIRSLTVAPPIRARAITSNRNAHE